MSKSAKRQAARSRRLRFYGLLPRQVWAHPDDWPQIKRLENELKDKRMEK